MNKKGFLIEDIAVRGAPCFFISPHPDDAILSAGDLISSLTGISATRLPPVPVTVVTIFTEISLPQTISARRFLARCGYKDPIKFFQDRRDEDAKACAMAGAESVHLGFIDALWRKKQDVVSRNFFGKILPELGHIYPTYRFHVARGKASRRDDFLIQEIADKIKTAVGHDTDAVIFCPMGIGGHVDHLIARRAVEHIAARPIYWADFPYSVREPGVLNRSLSNFDTTEQWQNNSDLKLRMILEYATQFRAVFPDGEVPLRPEIFAESPSAAHRANKVL